MPTQIISSTSQLHQALNIMSLSKKLENKQAETTTTLLIVLTIYNFYFVKKYLYNMQFVQNMICT